MTQNGINYGIISRYEDFRQEEMVQRCYFDEEEMVDKFYDELEVNYPGVELEDYMVQEEKHPNNIICVVLWRYMSEELGIKLQPNAQVMDAYLHLLQRAYHGAFLVAEKRVMEPVSKVGVNQILVEAPPKDVYALLSSTTIVNSVMCILLHIDTKVEKDEEMTQFLDRMEKMCNKSLIDKEPSFYSLLKDAFMIDTAADYNVDVLPNDNSQLLFADNHMELYWAQKVRTFIRHYKIKKPLDTSLKNPALAMMYYFREAWKREGLNFQQDADTALVHFFTHKCGVQLKQDRKGNPILEKSIATKLSSIRKNDVQIISTSFIEVLKSNILYYVNKNV